MIPRKCTFAARYIQDKENLLKAATCAPFVMNTEYTPVFSPLSCRKNMSFTLLVPTDIMPPNPKPHIALVPRSAAKFGDDPLPIPPTIVIIIANSVTGRRP